MEKFYLNLELILQRFRQSGELLSDIPAKKIGNKAPWRARIRVDEGKISSCQIFDHRDAIVSSGGPALEALYKIGPLYWEVIPDLAGDTGKIPVMQPLKKPNSGSLSGTPERIILPRPSIVPNQERVPYRLVNVTLKQMNQTQWPRDYRMVYILIDGTRGSEKIARMLALPLADVELILSELQSMRIIDIKV